MLFQNDKFSKMSLIDDNKIEYKFQNITNLSFIPNYLGCEKKLQTFNTNNSVQKNH